MKKSGIAALMPPNPAPHIIARLIEAGLTESGGMGAAPLSWQSIRAWRQETGTHLAAWEAKLLRQLSVEYLSEGRRAESENCPPPWHAEVTKREIETEENRLRALLG